ncbi:MAG: amino acid adenylation domain-containing protein [Pedobacter sp.]|nr:MAG: amino acid adenylation domain-containing protein [Pedobacter sp.]
MIDEKINTPVVNFNPFEAGKEIEKIVVINESQREIWLSCIIGGEVASLAYNESFSLKLTGPFSLPDFKRAFETVVQRHEALRSSVSTNGEYFIIYKSLEIAIDFANLEQLNTEEKANTLDGFLKNQMLTPIDLQDSPLFRLYVHRFTPTEHYVTVVIHHIICDGWSTGIILENISKAYNAIQKGLSPNLPPVVQISNYAVEQFDYLQRDEFRATESFWLNLYKGDVPLVDLPTDFERGKSRTYKAARIDYKLPAKFVSELKKTGAKAGCSLVNTMLSLFEIFLSQQTKQSDIVVGLPAAGQLATDNQELVGHCVNILPIRSKIDSKSSFLEYLKKSKSIFLDAYEHQLFSFGQLLKNLNFKRDSSRIPLVPIVFNIDMGMSSAVNFDDLAYELISNPRAYETFEIFLNATGTEDALVLEWTYNTQLFKENTINRMIAEFEGLLNAFVANPNNTIEQISLKNTPKLQIASSIGTTAVSEKTLLDLFKESSRNYANKTAVSFNTENLTYAQIANQANSLATLLIEEGVKQGDIVAIATERSAKMLISLLAIMKAGAVYLPLDPEYPQDRIEFMLADADAKTILLSKKYQHAYQSNARKLVIEDLWPNLKTTREVTVPVSATDVAYLLYTSGSTGKPKGVQITHKNLANFLTSMQSQPGITERDCLLAITTISFDIAGLELYLPLIAGATLVLASTEATKDGRLLLSILEEQTITMMQATPSTWQMMLDSGWKKPIPIKVLSGGEALAKDLAEKLLSLSAELWNMYGPTETTIWSTVKRIMPKQETLTIGKAIQNTQIFILNDENKPLSINEIGEICIGGDGVALGYLNRKELTDEKFISHFDNKTNGKLYKTGDLGKILSNGEVVCLGRIDQQIKIRGHRIELGEIETIIAQQNGIKQAVVKAQEITAGDKRLVAYITVNEGDTSIKYETLNNFGLNLNAKSVAKEIIANWKENLKELLPAYMVPDYFIALDSFPLTPNAKIDRKILPSLKLTNATPCHNTVDLSANEKMIAEIWSAVLGVQNLQATDDFFELGGHSLLAIKVMVAIEKRTGTRLPLTVLFDNSTVAGLASHLTKNDQTEHWKSLIPIKTSGKQPPLYIVHGQGMNIIGFRSLAPELNTDQPFYGLQAKGLNPDDEPLEDVEEIATGYIKEMIQANPLGPYALLGYSSGGIIALEMATQLEKMGKKVSFLGLLDTYVDPNNYKELFNKKDYNGIISFTANSIKYALSCLIKFPVAYLVHNKNFVLGTLYNNYKKLNPIKPDKSNPLYVLDRLQKAHERALKRYKFKQYKTPVFLFKANDNVMNYVRFGETNGFKPYIEAKINTIDIPLKHLQFFEPPFVKIFAAALDDAMNSTNAKI